MPEIPFDLLNQLSDLIAFDSTPADMLKSVYDTGASSGSASVDLADAILGGSAAGNSKYYGTDPSGVLGFNTLPSCIGHAIKDEGGAALTQRAIMNFIGAGVTATDNPGTTSTDVTVLGGNEIGHNLIINGGFDLFQRLKNTPTTLVAMTDDVYNAPDRWYSLIQGANPTIAQAAGIGTSKNSVKLRAGGTTNRYGIAQIINSENSFPFRGNNVIAQCRVKPINNAGSGTRDYRIAILEWTGVADVVISELVANWASAVYTTAGFFASTTITLVGTAMITATHNVESVLSVTGPVSTSCKNLIVFIWIEDVPINASDYVLIGEAGLFDGTTVLSWLPTRLIAEELIISKWYYEMIFPNLAFAVWASGFAQSTNTSIAPFYFSEKRVVPIIVISDPTSFNILYLNTSINTTGLTLAYICTKTALFTIITDAVLTAGIGIILRGNNSILHWISLDSEL